MPEDAFIITKADPTGKITYANRQFINISGYQESELLGKPHNIIRHPDMPRAIFQLLWDTLESGQEFNGYIKNLCKNGNFYWVLANITPSFGARGELLGYYSVRRRPNEEALQKIQHLYENMLNEESKSGSKDAIAASTAVLNTEVNTHGINYDRYVLTL